MIYYGIRHIPTGGYLGISHRRARHHGKSILYHGKPHRLYEGFPKLYRTVSAAKHVLGWYCNPDNYFFGSVPGHSTHFPNQDLRDVSQWEVHPIELRDFAA